MSKTSAKKPTSKPNLYQTVTDRFVASLKNGIIPWEKPWNTPHFTGGPFPRNFRTGRPYRGINIMLLWSSPYCSRSSGLPLNQAIELNGTVRRGEKGTQIVFYKQLRTRKTTNEQQSEEEDRRPPFVLVPSIRFSMLSSATLQLCPRSRRRPSLNTVEQDEACEAIAAGWENRPTLHLTDESERRAYYRPSTDSVHMPACPRFVDAPHGYSTLFHEPLHSTGHESRLNRTFGARFGDELYSKEELVAVEMGAAFRMRHRWDCERAHRPEHYGVPSELDWKAGRRQPPHCSRRRQCTARR